MWFEVVLLVKLSWWAYGGNDSYSRRISNKISPYNGNVMSQPLLQTGNNRMTTYAEIERVKLSSRSYLRRFPFKTIYPSVVDSTPLPAD